MRKLKKFLATLFIMIFVVGVIPAFAQGGGKITIKNDPSTTGASMKGHSYAIYKVFDLTFTDGKYSYTIDNDFEDFFTEKTDKTLSELQKFAKEYITTGPQADVAKELTEYITTNNIVADKTTDVATEELVTVSGVALGYYLVADKGVADTSVEHQMAAIAMGSTDVDLEITLKAQGPTITKEIKHNENGTWGNVGDNQIGDKVEYRFRSTVPDTNYYNEYEYIIHDKMTEGLTFNNDVKIYINGEENELDSKYYTVITDVDHADTFDIDIDILAAIKDGKIKATDELYTKFTAKLNANIAKDSNNNEVLLEYSNNPYVNTTTKTPPVEVKDYTFKINALKTIEDGKTGLQGAKFEVRREGNAISFIQEGNKYIVCPKGSNHEQLDCTTTLISSVDGTFEIVGLDDVTEYTIVETEAPNGYNKIDPIKFSITAAYKDDGTIKSISTNSDKITQVEGTFELGTTIVNTTDQKLPETGGVGTTIFTIVGILLMGTAAVVLVKRRKVS